jgi:hypothetical protein
MEKKAQEREKAARRKRYLSLVFFCASPDVLFCAAFLLPFCAGVFLPLQVALPLWV